MKVTKSRNAINKALADMANRIDRTEKFVVDQAPSICKEIIAEGILDASMDISSSLVVIIFSVILAYLTGKYALGNGSGSGDLKVVSGIGSLLLLAATVGAAAKAWHRINILLTIKRCPKLFILREFRRLVGQ